jgi:hypothetical protein
VGAKSLIRRRRAVGAKSLIRRRRAVGAKSLIRRRRAVGAKSLMLIEGGESLSVRKVVWKSDGWNVVLLCNGIITIVDYCSILKGWFVGLVVTNPLLKGNWIDEGSISKGKKEKGVLSLRKKVSMTPGSNSQAWGTAL